MVRACASKKVRSAYVNNMICKKKKLEIFEKKERDRRWNLKGDFLKQEK